MKKIIFGQTGVLIALITFVIDMIIRNIVAEPYWIIGVVNLIAVGIFWGIILKTSDQANDYNDPKIALADTTGDAIAILFSATMVFLWVHLADDYGITDAVFYVEVLLLLIAILILNFVELRRTAWLAYKRFSLLDKSQILNVDNNS